MPYYRAIPQPHPSLSDETDRKRKKVIHMSDSSLSWHIHSRSRPEVSPLLCLLGSQPSCSCHMEKFRARSPWKHKRVCLKCYAEWCCVSESAALTEVTSCSCKLWQSPICFSRCLTHTGCESTIACQQTTCGPFLVPVLTCIDLAQTSERHSLTHCPDGNRWKLFRLIQCHHRPHSWQCEIQAQICPCCLNTVSVTAKDLCFVFVGEIYSKCISQAFCMFRLHK